MPRGPRRPCLIAERFEMARLFRRRSLARHTPSLEKATLTQSACVPFMNRWRSSIDYPRSTPTGQFDLELDTASAGGWSQADKGNGIVFPFLRLKRDRRTGLQI